MTTTLDTQLKEVYDQYVIKKSTYDNAVSSHRILQQTCAKAERLVRLGRDPQGYLATQLPHYRKDLTDQATRVLECEAAVKTARKVYDEMIALEE